MAISLAQGDYSRWFREAVKDPYLADHAERIEQRQDLRPAETRELMLSFICRRALYAARVAVIGELPRFSVRAQANSPGEGLEAPKRGKVVRILRAKLREDAKDKMIGGKQCLLKNE